MCENILFHIWFSYAKKYEFPGFIMKEKLYFGTDYSKLVQCKTTKKWEQFFCRNKWYFLLAKKINWLFLIFSIKKSAFIRETFVGNKSVGKQFYLCIYALNEKIVGRSLCQHARSGWNAVGCAVQKYRTEFVLKITNARYFRTYLSIWSISAQSKALLDQLSFYTWIHTIGAELSWPKKKTETNVYTYKPLQNA